MLFTLGLRRFPPIDVLLGIAAGRPPMNQKALDYLLANLQTHYLNFDPKVFEGVAFLPAAKPDGTQILAKPGEVSYCLYTRSEAECQVYTNWSCAILGFAIADQSIASPDIASKLRIPTDPPMEALVSAFLSRLPKDIDQARKIFEVGWNLGECTDAIVPSKQSRSGECILIRSTSSDRFHSRQIRERSSTPQTL